MSDTTDTSVDDSPPPVIRKRVRKARTQSDPSSPGVDRSSPQSQPESIKRSHLLAALRTLENDLKETLPDVDPIQEKLRSKRRAENFKRVCSFDLSTHPVTSSGRTPTKTRQLEFALINSVFRHDWSTAAHCLQLMLNIDRCRTFVLRTLPLVLLNHPQTNTEVMDNFLSRVLNLRKRSEQLTFLRQLFLLPEDVGAYNRHQHLMSTTIQDEGMTTSGEEE